MFPTFKRFTFSGSKLICPLVFKIPKHFDFAWLQIDLNLDSDGDTSVLISSFEDWKLLINQWGFEWNSDHR